MLIEKAACTFISKIAGGKTGDRHDLLDYLLWRKAQFKPLGFVFPLRRCWFLTGGRHNRTSRLYVRQYTVLYKSDGHSRNRPHWRAVTIINLGRHLRVLLAPAAIQEAPEVAKLAEARR
jgi:hypothetical protein